MKIRFATVADVDSISNVNYQSWQETYRGIVDDKFLDRLSAEQYKTRKWLPFLSNTVPHRFMFVVENDEGIVVGYCCAGRAQKSLGDIDAELYALYLLRQYHGKGIGRALFTKSINELKERGFKACCLYVLRDNPTVNFYRSFKPDVEGSIIVELGDKEYTELAFGWSDLKMFDSRDV